VKGEESAEVNSLYSRIERRTKLLESRIGSCVGADGAAFAIRKALYPFLEADDINDLVIPLKIVRKGYRGIQEEGVFCREEIDEDPDSVARRQIRITARTLRALFKHRELLNPLEFPLFSLQIVSHKLLKLLCPFWLMSAFILNLLLLWKNEPIYGITLALQIAAYAMAVVGLKQTRPRSGMKCVVLCSTFVLVNYAYVIGWVKYLSGETFTSWIPER